MTTYNATIFFAFAALLTACGGGGGGSTVAAPQTTPTAVPTAQIGAQGSITSLAGCEVPTGQSNCMAMVSYTTVNALAPVFTVNGKEVSTAKVLTNFAFSIGAGDFAVTLTSLGVDLLAGKTASVSGTCASGGKANAAGVCQALVAGAWLADVKTIVEIGTPVRTFSFLNPGADYQGGYVGNPYITANLANGNVQVIKTGVEVTDTDGVKTQIYLNSYRQTSGSICFQPVYANSGKLWQVFACYDPTDAGYIKGTKEGHLSQDKTRNICYLTSYQPVVISKVVDCPL